MTDSYQGKTAIVTGGGSGIGRAVALQLAARGANVVVADINAERAREVADDILEIGTKSLAVSGDLAEQRVVDALVRQTISEFATIDLLVNNAGIMDDMSATHEVSDDLWSRVLSVNLTAPFLLSRAVLPHMLAQGRGAIVNTASEAGLRGSAAGTAYTVSKHGVIGLTKSTAVLYKEHGVRVNAVAPGGTQTNLVVNVKTDAMGLAAIGTYAGNVGRIAQADEVAAAIVFLGSDEASDITGVVLPVDGGWSAV